MLVRHLEDVRCESVLDPRLKCFCPSLKFPVWCWSQSAAETNIESSGGTFYVIWYFWNVSSRESRVIVFQYEPPDSWTVADPGPGPGQARVPRVTGITNTMLRPEKVMPLLSVIIPQRCCDARAGWRWHLYQDPGRKRKNARRCDKKWRRWSVGLLRWWRRGGGSQREHNPSR